MTLAHQGDDTGLTPVKTVIGKMHYNWRYGVGGHDWKITNPQAMEFFWGQKNFHLHKYVLLCVVLGSRL